MPLSACCIQLHKNIIPILPISMGSYINRTRPNCVPSLLMDCQCLIERILSVYVANCYGTQEARFQLMPTQCCIYVLRFLCWATDLPIDTKNLHPIETGSWQLTLRSQQRLFWLGLKLPVGQVRSCLPNKLKLMRLRNKPPGIEHSNPFQPTGNGKQAPIPRLDTLWRQLSPLNRIDRLALALSLLLPVCLFLLLGCCWFFTHFDLHRTANKDAVDLATCRAVHSASKSVNKFNEV